MTDIGSLIVAGIASNSWVTYITIKLLTMIQRKLKVFICTFYHVTDCLSTYLHARNYYKIGNMYGLLICILHIDICCYIGYFQEA